jgi:hypothetical protein
MRSSMTFAAATASAGLGSASHYQASIDEIIRRVERSYNPPVMKFRRLLSVALAVALAASSGGTVAQGFGSVSSGKRMPDAAAPPAASETMPAPEVPAATAAEPNPVVPTTGAVADPGATAGSAATVPFGGAYADAVTASPPGLEPADRVLVKKSERRLYLLRSDRVIADYPIKLGINPWGPKQREGDFRTPEGVYEIAARNPRSDFFLSLKVSYPNEADRDRARELGTRPGGLIMIHGQPNTPRKPPDYYASSDWTDGCIAVSNSDMVDIWLRTAVGVPIEIRP